MKYTEKEQKGVNKVERMNKFFDKILLPFIGVLIILFLISFIAGKLLDKFDEPKASPAASSYQSNSQQPKEFKIRATLLDNYEKYKDEFAAYGYEPANGYSQELAIVKIVDDEFVIYQFKDGTLGDFTILRYTPSESVDSRYNSVSMTVSSSSLINVTVNSGDSMCTVAFTSINFSTYSKDDNAQYNKMMKLLSIDELKAMYEIFETDISNLGESCGVS